MNEEHMTEILLFFIIVSEMIVKTQDMEKIVEKKDEMTEEEKIKLLASDGMLIKRPLIVSDDKILVGFKEQEWKEYFNK